MKTYLFVAKTDQGQLVRGQLEAYDQREVQEKIRAQRLSPVRILQKSEVPGATLDTNKKSIASSVAVKKKDLLVFTRQFAVLIDSGIPVLQSLESLKAGTSSLELKRVTRDILTDLQNGSALGDAMARHPKTFDRFYLSLIRAGEKGGVLDTVLVRLAESLEKSMKLHQKVRGALVYPATLIAIAVAITTAIMLFVVPNFVDVYRSNGMQIPWSTQLLIDTSAHLVGYWYVYVGCIGVLLFITRAFYTSPSGRAMLDPVLLAIPMLGGIICKGALARVSKTLSVLLASGVSVLEAVETSAETAGNTSIEEAFIAAGEHLEKGGYLSDSLKAQPAIPQIVIGMIAVGEFSGQLDELLAKISDFYETEVELSLEAMVSLIEPTLMIVLGGSVGFIVVLMYLPIFQMATMVSG